MRPGAVRVCTQHPSAADNCFRRAQTTLYVNADRSLLRECSCFNLDRRLSDPQASQVICMMLPVILTFIWEPRGRHTRREGQKRTKNGRRSCADVVSMGLSALDRKSVTSTALCRCCDFVRLLCCLGARAAVAKTGLRRDGFDACRTTLWQAGLAGCGSSAQMVRRGSGIT